MNIAWWHRFRHPQPRQIHRFDEHTVVLWQSRELWTSAGHVPPGGRADILTHDSTHPIGKIPDAARCTNLREHGASAFHVICDNHDLSAREGCVGKIDVDVRLGELAGQLAEGRGPVIDGDYEDLALVGDPHSGALKRRPASSHGLVVEKHVHDTPALASEGR